jgi:NAD(P)-dependent dehydrogenase (short-subunit alcohol dehydrogenase family)
MSGRFSGKVALITGAASGVGKETARLFAKEGARVVLSDIDAAGGGRAEVAIHAAGGEAIFLRADVASAADVEALIKETIVELGTIDLAVNAAGVAPESTNDLRATGDLDDASWSRIISVDLYGLWLSMKYELTAMAANKSGVIVNLASTLSFAGAPGLSAYAAAKHGVLSLTVGAAVEYAASGVRVHAVCPGRVRSPIGDRLKALGRRRWSAAPSQDHRPGVEDIARAILWLCSEDAQGLTGQCLVIDSL